MIKDKDAFFYPGLPFALCRFEKRERVNDSSNSARHAHTVNDLVLQVDCRRDRDVLAIPLDRPKVFAQSLWDFNLGKAPATGQPFAKSGSRIGDSET